MLELIDQFRTLIAPETIITAGYIIMALVIFSETGILAGFFLPGDSLLITAGLFAARGDLDIVTLNVVLLPAAIIGDATGYWIGSIFGKKLFNKPDSRFFKKEYVDRTQAFYAKYGNKTIVIARFVPIVRTFAPVMAGVGSMKYSTFSFYNIFGGVLWICGLSFTGYFLGNLFPVLVEHLEKVILLVIFLSILPILIEVYKARNAQKNPH